jgi:hypothetical protein
MASKSGRAMIEALIDGERRPAVLADLAIGRMRSKTGDLAMALEGRFSSHHALMCRLHLDHIAHLEQMIARLDAQIETMMQPYRTEQDLLATIPGIGQLAAAAIISEIGADVRAYFPTAAHLASWAGICPGNHESAGKQRSGKRRHGNQNLEPVLAEAAWSAARHQGYLQSLYHRHVTKSGGYRSTCGKNKAIITVATPSSSSSGTSWPPAPPTRNSAPTTSTAAWTPNAKPAASSPNSKPSDTRSPWTPPSDPSRPGSRQHKSPSAADARLAGDHSHIRGVDLRGREALGVRRQRRADRVICVGRRLAASGAASSGGALNDAAAG